MPKSRPTKEEYPNSGHDNFLVQYAPRFSLYILPFYAVIKYTDSFIMYTIYNKSLLSLTNHVESLNMCLFLTKSENRL
jgi:hypothetical protein